MNHVSVPSGTSFSSWYSSSDGDVHHPLERDHRHAELRLQVGEQLLGGVQAVEGMAAESLARAGVIAADDEVGARRGSCG